MLICYLARYNVCSSNNFVHHHLAFLIISDHSHSPFYLIKWAAPCENVFWGYTGSEGSDQPAYPSSLLGPSLSANRIIGHYKLRQWRAKARMRLYAWDESESVHCDRAWRYLSAWGRGFNPRRGRQHSFEEIDHEIFSTVILSLPLIQEGQLSVSGERMCTVLVNRLED